MSFDTTTDLPPLAPTDSSSTASTRSAISIQLNESLLKTRTILKQFRARSDNHSSEDDVRSLPSFAEDLNDEDELHSLSTGRCYRNSLISISHPDFQVIDNSISDLEANPSLSQSFDGDGEMKNDGDEMKGMDDVVDDDTKAPASLPSKLLTRKREKKNAALSKLQGMLSNISSLPSITSTSSESTFGTARTSSSISYSTYSTNIEKSSIKKEEKTRENNKLPITTADICYKGNIQVYDSFMILRL